MNPGKAFWAICLSLPAVVALDVPDAGAQLTLSEDFEANEAVESLIVRIAVGADGEDLDEPVTLDLGLGFPFLLHPVGRADDEAAPFGAVPQLTTASRSVTAGADACFAFSLDGQSEQDPLQTTSQLLSGVRISDISRIGFASQGATDWTLEAYEIRINGRPFAANDAVNADIGCEQELARARLVELEPEITPLAEETDDLRALIEAGLATDEDRQRVQDIGELLVPLLAEQNRLERQLRGAFPWFEESGFRSPWRQGAEIKDIRITLLTYPHAGADTRNYVYFRTGGHKYLLGSPDNPLGPEHGPQTFRLDLQGGPLTAADLRGKALGMIAHSEPFGDEPDRWHPQRLMIELDGSLVYDSEENEVDRLSIEAIRIIPPAHVDEAGNCVENAPCVRETFVWEGGSGAGLDLITGGVAELPEEDTPLYPEAEPGLVGDEAVESFDDGMYVGFDDYLFPGEAFYGDDWCPGYDGGFGYWDDGYWGDEYWDDGYWHDGYGWGDALVDLLYDLLGPDDPYDIPGLDDILEELIGDALEPDPVGEPLQITNVRLVTDGPDRWIHWEVTGDESNVAGYTVGLLMLYPHLEYPVGGTVPVSDGVPAGIHSALVDAAAFDAANAVFEDDFADYADDAPEAHPFLAYIMPVVSADFHEGDHAVTEPMQLGPAQPLHLSHRPVGPWGECRDQDSMPVDYMPEGEPAHVGSAAWLTGPLNSHIGFAFDSMGRSARNVVMRPGPELDSMTLSFDRIRIASPRWSLVTHAGFVGDRETVNAARVHADCHIRHDFIFGMETDLRDSVDLETHAADPQPLEVLRVDIDTSDLMVPGPLSVFRVTPSLHVRGPPYKTERPHNHINFPLRR